MFREIVLNSLAYLGFFSVTDILRMSIVEYQLRFEAYQLRRAERHEELAMQAWYSQMVKSTKGSSKHPKPRFSRFDELYDREAEINKVRSQFEPDFEISQYSPIELKRKQNRLFAKRLAEFNELKKQGKIIPLSERRKEEANGSKL